ncbi:MAG: ParB/RepB/Spo0J family partition protein [Synergistaceae bacterium]|jgi:ParB family chromosome partitioning protein|nr:ParB/RepB/Spo0J family partition protein [Synergistaceae bacterium]
MAKRGLGKGLSSLIPTNADRQNERAGATDNDTHETLKDVLYSVGCDELSPSPFQPRGSITEDGLENLAASIKEHGIIQPVLVRGTQSGYQIIAGERRWRASQLAGLNEIPIRILEISDSQAMELALVENLQREDLSSIEIARGIQEIITKFSLTHEDVAEKIGLSRTAVTNKLRLLQLPQTVIQMLENNEITEGHARTLLSLPSADKIIDFANITVQRALNVRQLEQLVKSISDADKIDEASSRKEQPEAEFQDEISRLKNNYKLTVTVAGGRKGMGVMIKGLKKWQVQLLLEYIERHGDELLPRE